MIQAAWSVFIECLAVIFRGTTHLMDNRNGSKHPYQAVRIRIPLCPNCQKTQGIPSPQQVDFEKGSMAFVIPRDVAEKL